MTGTTKDDWTITRESAQERSTGRDEVQEGSHASFPKIMAQVSCADGCGDFEHSKGTLNRLLGLPTEDINEATKAAIERAKSANSTG